MVAVPAVNLSAVLFLTLIFFSGEFARKKILLLEVCIDLASGFLIFLFSIQETATNINKWISCFYFFISTSCG